MKTFWGLLFFCFFVHVKVLAQFEFPLVPAEFNAYYSKCSEICAAGISSRIDYRYKISEGKVLTENFPEREIHFNKDGKIQEIIYSDDKFRKRLIVTYTYDSRGYLSRETHFEASGEIRKRIDYKYTIEGCILEKSVFDQYDYIQSKEVYEIEGNKLVRKNYDSPGMISETEEWVYDDILRGNLIEHIVYEGTSVFKSRRKIFREGDVIIKEEIYTSVGQVAYLLIYNYNTDNLLESIIKVFPSGSQLNHLVCKYQVSGILINSLEYDRNGFMSKYYKYMYTYFSE